MDAYFESLWRHFVRGWKFSKTRLTEEYGYERFVADLPAEGMQLLFMNDVDDIGFVAADRQSEPGPGTTIVYFARARESLSQDDVSA